MILFRNSMPQLDLHGLDRVECGIKIKHFIDDNIFLRNEEFAIIHGIGSGILKKETWNILKKDKRIEDTVNSKVVQYAYTDSNVDI